MVSKTWPILTDIKSKPVMLWGCWQHGGENSCGHARRPPHWHPTIWGIIKALTVPWAWLHSTPHLMELGKASWRDKAPSPHPMPRDGLSTPLTWAKWPLWSTRDKLPSHSCKTPGPGGITRPVGWRSPADAKRALTAPISTTHKGQEVVAFLMALLTSKSHLPQVASGWGMLAPDGCLLCYHPT